MPDPRPAAVTPTPIAPSRDAASTYLAAFVVLGLSAGAVGPALPALRDQVSVSVSGISLVFVASSSGYLAGSIAGGRGYDRGHGHRLLALALAGMAAAFLAVAVAPTLGLLCLAFAATGVTSAAVDVGGNVLLVWSRNDRVGPMMNALHLCFGVGALLGPLIVDRSTAWAGGIGAAWVIVAVAAVGVGAMVWPKSSPAPHRSDDHPAGSPPVLVLAVCSVFFLLYVGVELGFAGWVFTYAEEVGFTGSAPALLTAAFWASFTLGRLASVPLARRVAPGRTLAVAGALAIAGAALLVVASGAPAGAWAGTVLFALGVAPQYPTMMTYLSRHLALSGKATSWFVGASAVGGLTLPWLIGQRIDAAGADAMPVLVLVCASVTFLWFGLVVEVLRRSRPAVATESVA